MTARHRLIRSLILTLFTAATLARAELGPDTEASAVFTPAFAAAVPLAFAGAWIVAGQFGRAGAAGWVRAFAVAAGLLIVAGLVVPVLLPLLGGIGGGPLMLLSEVPRWPLAWGAALAGALAAQVVALRQGRDAGGQSRK